MTDKTWSRENGARVDETPQAKLRNKLWPFWTLVDFLKEDHRAKLLSRPWWEEKLYQLVEKCRQNQEVILDLIKQTEK